VRAPTEGFVTQVALRPGMNVVPAPLRPVMVFVHTRVRDQMLAAAFQQNALQRVRAGDEPKSHSMLYREGFSKLKFVNEGIGIEAELLDCKGNHGAQHRGAQALMMTFQVLFESCRYPCGLGHATDVRYVHDAL